MCVVLQIDLFSPMTRFNLNSKIHALHMREKWFSAWKDSII